MRIFAAMIFLSACFIGFAHPLAAQINPGLLDFSSLTVSGEASDLAMGESFVANPYGISAFTHNPANLMGATGVNVFYTYRDNAAFNFLDPSQYTGYGATMATSAGNFGVGYHHFLLGRFTVTDVQNPAGQPSQVEFLDYTLSLAYARNYSEQLTLGAAVKWYDADIKTVSGPAIGFSSNKAVVFDLGLVYWIPGFIASRELADHFFFGASIQNFGTDFELKVEPAESFTAQQLARFFRFGFTYRLHVKDPGSSFSFRYFLTGEYRRYLNPPDDYDKSNCDFGGLGFSAMFFDIIALQLGAQYTPHDNLTGEEDRFNLRYGVGIQLALEQFGSDYPVDFIFQFAHIPVNHSGWVTDAGDTKNLSAFSIQIAYRESIF